MTITSFSPTARLMFLLAVVGFLTIFTPQISLAGSYSVSYGGGTITGGKTYAPSNGSYVGAFGGNVPPGTGGTGGLSGTVTATFTWASDPNNPNDQPPQCVVVTETCTASWGGITHGSGTCTGSCDNGLGASSVPAQGGPGATSAGSGYVVQNNPGTSFTIQCMPKASITLGGSGSNSAHGVANVSYSASASPMTVQLTGTTSDSSGAKDILTGQQCTATLKGTPSGCTVTSYAWSTSGGNAFETYDTGAPNATHTTQLVPLSSQDMYASNFSFYDGKNGDSITVICGAIITTPTNSQLTVTAQATPITVFKPQVTAWGITGGIVRSPQGIAGLFPIPGDSVHKSGQSWHDVTITVPAPFSGGTFDFAQVITPTRQIYRNLPQGSNAPAYYHVQNSGTLGLDTVFPYDPQFSIPSQPTVELSGDSPQVGVPGVNLSVSQLTVTDNGGSDWYETTASDQFTTWLIYLPPAVGNQGTIWVPLQKYDWNWSGAEELQDGAWTFTTGMPDTPSSPSPSNTDTPPSWTVTHKGTDSYSP